MVLFVVISVFIAFGVAILWRPASVLALAFCVYPFEQWAQANSVFFQQHSAAMNYGTGVLALLALAVVILRGRNPLNPVTGATWCWLALYVYAAVSCVWAANRELSVFLFKYHLPYMVTMVGILPLIVQDFRDVRYALKLTLFAGTFVLLLLFFGTRVHEWGRTIVVEEGAGVVDRVGGHNTRMTPLMVASMAGQILLIAVLMNFVGIGRLWQVLRWGIGFVALALIFRSQSRGQLIAATMAVIALVPYSRGSKKITGPVMAFATIVLVIALAVLAYNAFESGGKRWSMETMEQEFQATRLQYSTQLLSYWFSKGPLYWLFGVGSSTSFEIMGVYCHIVIVEILCELGFVSFCVFLAYLIFVARDGLRLLRVCRSSIVDRGVAATVVAIFLFQFILTFKEGSFLTHTFTLGWGLILSRAAALKLAEHRRENLKAVQQWYMRYLSPDVSGVPGHVARPSY